MSRGVVVVSQSWVVRAGLSVLANTGPFELVGELSDAHDVPVSVNTTGAELVLAAPLGSWRDQTYEVLARLPASCRTLVFLPDPGYRIQTTVLRQRYGLAAVPLEADANDLFVALRSAVGAAPAAPTTLEADPRCAGPSGVLTDREHDVLRALAHGLSNKSIARRLTLSHDTVKSHLRSIYRKLEVESRGEAISVYVGEFGQPV